MRHSALDGSETPLVTVGGRGDAHEPGARWQCANYAAPCWHCSCSLQVLQWHIAKAQQYASMQLGHQVEPSSVPIWLVPGTACWLPPAGSCMVPAPCCQEPTAVASHKGQACWHLSCDTGVPRD